jgi:predicted RNA binding protein YcfA (HicA-like mRNA interferase family)
MKYTEFHKKIKQNGWIFSHAVGSHYFYAKDDKLSQPIPYHGAKEIGTGLKNKIIKEMGLNK